jgi:predicted Rossmann-fold nucleotide-binding protein
MGTSFWAGLMDWLRTRVVEDQLISADDPELLVVTDDVEEVIDIVCAARDGFGDQASAGGSASA